MTSPTRFGGQGNVNTHEIISALNPYSKGTNHGTYSMGALSEPEDMIVENQDIDSLLENIEDPANKFCCLSNSIDDNVLQHRIACKNLMSTSYTFRGNFSQREFSDSIY